MIFMLITIGSPSAAQSPFLREGPACFGATPPPTTALIFQKTYGGVGNDYIAAVKETPDGGFIAVGSSMSCTSGVKDILLVKIDSTGTIQWTRNFSNALYDVGIDVLAKDDGYIILASTKVLYMSEYILIIRTDLLGQVLWERTYRGFAGYGGAIISAHNGDYIVTGNSGVAFLMRMDTAGNVYWMKTYSNSGRILANAMFEEADGSIIVTGAISGSDYDMLLYKTDSVGNFLWSKKYAMTGDESGYGITKGANGNYYIVTENTQSSTVGYATMYQLDTLGNLLRAKTYSSSAGSGICAARSIVSLANGNLVMGGKWDANATGTLSNGLLMRTNNEGNVLWCRKYGSANTQFANRLAKTGDGGFIVGGQTNKSGSSGIDGYIVKTNPDGVVDSAEILVTPVVASPSVSTSSVSLSTTSIVVSPNLIFSPTSLNFGLVPVGKSVTQYVLLRNAGIPGALTINGVSSIPGYIIVPNPPVSYPLVLPAGASQIFSVTYTPTALGTNSGNIVFSHSGTGGMTNLFVNGQGGTMCGLNPTSLAFGEIACGTSSTKSVTVTNLDPVEALSISGATPSESYSVTPTPSTSYPIILASGESRNFDVTFSPTVIGLINGSIVFRHSGRGDSTILPISGTGGNTNIAFSTNSLNFGNVPVGGSSTQTLVVTNSGTINALLITSASSRTYYNIVPNPPSAYPISVLPGASQNFDVTFTPPSASSYSGNIGFSHNAVGGSTNIPVTGTGQAGGVQFKIPFHFEQSGVGLTSTLWIGISGDGPGGIINDNTYTYDGDPVFGDAGQWREYYYWDDFSYGHDFMALAVNIPGRQGITPNDYYSGLYPYDFRGFTSVSQVDTFGIHVRGQYVEVAPLNISWPNNLNQYGTGWVLKKKEGTSWNVVVSDMTSTSSYTDPNISNANYFRYLIIKTGAFSPTTGTAISLTGGWHLVSIPRLLSDYTADRVFTGKFGPMFSFNSSTNGYEAQTILANGTGYWVYYTSPSIVLFNGSGPGSQIITASQAGWVLIGSGTTQVNISSLIVSGGGAIFGDAFRYNCTTCGYETTTVINPGEAVWMYVTGECTITIP
jgi:hypothetical protein